MYRFSYRPKDRRPLGVHLRPLVSGETPKVILILHCRLGNQLHQIWIGQMIREMLNRPMYVIARTNTEGFNIYEEDLFSLPMYDSFEVSDANPCIMEDYKIDPFVKLIQYGDKIHDHDVVVSLFGECWTYIGEHEDYIRNLYQIRNPLVKRQRIIIHLRLGDVSERNTKNKTYMHFAIQTVKRIYKKEKTQLPIFVLAEETTHQYTQELVKLLKLEYGETNFAKVFNNENPCDDFRELTASSHIIATNSTFTYWACFLADPKTTEVYIGISISQPVSNRNHPLYELGAPANFHVWNLDLYQPYESSICAPKIRFKKVSVANCALIFIDELNDGSKEKILVSVKIVMSYVERIYICCLCKKTYDDMNIMLLKFTNIELVKLFEKEGDVLVEFMKLGIMKQLFVENIVKEKIIWLKRFEKVGFESLNQFMICVGNQDKDVLIDGNSFEKSNVMMLKNTNRVIDLLSPEKFFDVRMSKSFKNDVVDSYMSFMKNQFSWKTAF